MNAFKTSTAALLFALGGLAHASPGMYATSQVQVMDADGDSAMADYGTPDSGAVRATAGANGNQARAGATAAAGAGYASAQAWGGNHGGGGAAFAVAAGGFRDSITLVNEALTGQTGQVTLRFYYDYSTAYAGHASADALVNGNVSFAARAGDAFAGLSDYAAVGYANRRVYRKEDADGSTGEFHGHSGWLTLTTAFQWGEAFDIELHVETFGASLSPDATRFAFDNDASHAGYWDGVRAVSSGGSPVEQFAIRSASGADYSQSFVPDGLIPEPAGWMLWLAGAGMLVATRKLRR